MKGIIMNKFDYIEPTVDALLKCGFKYTLHDIDDVILMNVNIGADNIPTIGITVEFTDIGIISFNSLIAKCTDTAKRNAVFELLNRLMYDYKFIRFTIDDEGNINASYHLFAFSDDSFVISKQILLSMLSITEICDRVHPLLMKTIWGNGCTEEDFDYSGGIKFGSGSGSDDNEYFGSVRIDEELLEQLFNISGNDDDDLDLDICEDVDL